MRGGFLLRGPSGKTRNDRKCGEKTKRPEVRRSEFLKVRRPLRPGGGVLSAKIWRDLLAWLAGFAGLTQGIPTGELNEVEKTERRWVGWGPSIRGRSPRFHLSAIVTD